MLPTLVKHPDELAAGDVILRGFSRVRARVVDVAPINDPIYDHLVMVATVVGSDVPGQAPELYREMMVRRLTVHVVDFHTEHDAIASREEH